jgi:o-succinylbenzoate---CoA ligase
MGLGVNPFSVAAAAQQDPARTALILPGGASLTYAELADRTLRFARILAASGVSHGDRVATWSTNREAHVATILACLELGATIVPLHPRSTANEAEALLRAVTPTRTLLEDDLDELGQRAASVPPLSAAASIDLRAPAAIVHTSGTTGRPRGAILSRDAFRASADAAWRVLGHRPDEAWLLAMPVCHVGGLSILTRCLRARATVVLHEAFDPRAALEAKATIHSVVPTMLARLLEEDRDNALAKALVVVGGAPCPPSLLDECAARGVLALATYGLTEACAMVTVQEPRDRHARETGSGRALPGTEIKIVDERIHVRGPTVFSGYLGQPPHPPGAWFDTGDFGEIDAEGRLHVRARRVDLVVPGGENVYPAEVEAALESCAGVRRAFVFGVPDAAWGELVACAIERDERAPVAERDLFVAMSGVLASHKRPRRVCFVDGLAAAGDKIDRARRKTELLPLLRPWEK